MTNEKHGQEHPDGDPKSLQSSSDNVEPRRDDEPRDESPKSKENESTQVPDAGDTLDPYDTLIPEQNVLPNVGPPSSGPPSSGPESGPNGPGAESVPSDPVDNEATVGIESTVNDHDGADRNATNVSEPGEVTVDTHQADGTVVVDDDSTESTQHGSSGADLSESERIVVSTGRGASESANQKTKGNSQEETTANINFSTGAVNTDIPSEPDSVMASANIGETINPRELSGKDLAFWGSLSQRDSEQDPSVLPPAIDRSLTETKLQIRGRRVVPPKTDPSEPSDYRLVRLLGKGGMGNVYVARQGSLDRLLAVKVIKPLDKKKRAKLKKAGRLDSVEQERRQQFLSEAVVTGDLDHPNIVPIHDIAVTGDNTLFYSMKRVVGTPWSKEVKTKGLSENLEILLKACDGIGFAHTRGVVHRDIKPENIMLGECGEVMVMDWGLAVAKPGFEKLESVFPATGLGGSPAFMAPEMATGPVEVISPLSDIYLLGATLFVIITGKPPHTATNVSLCLRAAAQNKIREYSSEFDGELMDIALKAMASDPADRYQDVKSFQAAIREYRSHEQSISLRQKADEDLSQAKEERSYVDFSRACYGYEQALESWSENDEARQGLDHARLAHAEVAYENHDYDLGRSLLDPDDQRHRPTLDKIHAGIRYRDSRQKVVRGLMWTAAAMLAVILIGGSVSYKTVTDSLASESAAKTELETANKGLTAAVEETAKANRDLKIANAKKEQALIAVETADKLKAQALVAKNMALVDTKKANEDLEMAIATLEKKKAELQTANAQLVQSESNLQMSLDEEEKARIAETKAKGIAEYEVFVSRIGLAQAGIEIEAFDKARGHLCDLRESLGGKSVGWEWRWLWSQASQSKSMLETSAKVADLSVGQVGKLGVISFDDPARRPRLVALTEQGLPADFDRGSKPLLTRARVTATAISPSENRVATASYDTAAGAAIQMFDANGAAVGEVRADLPVGRITDLKFVSESLLVSASVDRTTRLWDLDAGQELVTCWHIASVNQVDAAKIPGTDRIRVAAVVGDESTGKVVVWDLFQSQSQWKQQRVGDFLEHSAQVLSVALSPDGSRAASGDARGGVRLWEPAQTAPLDYQKSIERSINNLGAATPNRDRSGSISTPLIDATLHQDIRLVSTTNSRGSTDSAHADAVRSMRFDRDGATLLTGSDDFTVKVWSVDDKELTRTLRGHAGWVRHVAFVGGEPDRVLSAAHDNSIRTWNPARYVDAAVVADLDSKNLTSRPHRDAISSAKFNQLGDKVLSTSRDHTARILTVDRERNEFTKVLELVDDDSASKPALLLSEGSSFVALSMARNDNRLYIGGADAVVRVWDLQRGTELGQARDTGLNSSLALSRSGRILLTGSSLAPDDQTVPYVKALVWHLDDNGLPVEPIELKSTGTAISAFAISPDDKFVFTGDRSGIGVIWDAKTGAEVRRVNAVRDDRINDAEFIDGSTLLLASDGKELTKIDLNTDAVESYKHDGFVSRVSVSGDRKFALTLSEERRDAKKSVVATFWDLESNAKQVIEKSSLIAEAAKMVSAEFGDSDRTAVIGYSATASSPAVVEVWRLGSTGVVATLSTRYELPSELGSLNHAMPLNAIDGRPGLLTLNGEAGFQWDRNEMDLRISYRAHAALTRGDFSDDGKYVVTSSRSVKIWDSETGKSLAKKEYPHQTAVRSVEFAPQHVDGRPRYLFATCGDDGEVKMWAWDQVDRAITAYEAFGPKVMSSPLRSICFSPDAKYLAAVSAAGFAYVWEIDGNGEPFEFNVSEFGSANCLQFTRDGKYLAIGSEDGTASLCPVVADKDRNVTVFKGHSGSIEDIAFIDQPEQPIRLITASRDRFARVWDPRLDEDKEDGVALSNREIERDLVALRKHTEGLTSVEVSSDSNIVLTAGRDGRLILWPATDVSETCEPADEGLFDDIISGK